jgi:triosephosphate isomerase (TIM)
MRRPLIAGNWKMNGMRTALPTISEVAKGLDAPLRKRVDVLICPPATILFTAAAVAIGSGIHVGAQDCHAELSGAFTGDLSATMLADAGASHIIVGHSERRTLHGETDAVVRAKAEAARAAAVVPVICIGETLEQREAGKTLAVVKRQLRGSAPADAAGHELVVAYEPVWAIGTGRTPTSVEVEAVHAEIRKELGRILGKGEAEKVRLLYGGSVKPSNAAELLALPNVDGALVGGASLNAADFLAIVRAA